MGDRYVISDENIKIIYMDATNLYGHSMSQMLPYDEIEMWHGHPDLYITKFKKLKRPDDADIGYFIEFDLNYPDEINEKTKIFHLLLKIKKLILMILVILWKKLNPILIHELKNWYVIGQIKKTIWFIIGCKNFMLDMEW